MMSCQNCPVARQSRQVLENAERLRVSMKRLRRMLLECQRCEQAAQCPLLQDFKAQFDIALQAVMDEWQLRGRYE